MANINEVIKVKTPPCPECKKPSEVEMTKGQYAAMQGTAYVQDIFPDWTPNQRELLITGFHAECWDKVIVDIEEGYGDI